MIANPAPHRRVPWNTGKLTGAKPPLRLKHVWSIRTKLQIEGRTRDLALFDLAIGGSPFKTFDEAEAACNFILKHLTKQN